MHVGDTCTTDLLFGSILLWHTLYDWWPTVYTARTKNVYCKRKLWKESLVFLCCCSLSGSLGSGWHVFISPVSSPSNQALHQSIVSVLTSALLPAAIGMWCSVQITMSMFRLLSSLHLKTKRYKYFNCNQRARCFKQTGGSGTVTAGIITSSSPAAVCNYRLK